MNNWLWLGIGAIALYALSKRTTTPQNTPQTITTGDTTTGQQTNTTFDTVQAGVDAINNALQNGQQIIPENANYYTKYIPNYFKNLTYSFAGKQLKYGDPSNWVNLPFAVTSKPMFAGSSMIYQLSPSILDTGKVDWVAAYESGIS